MKERGSAYILVLVVMLTVFMMSAVALTATGYEMKITSVYGRYVNLYETAASGIEKTCEMLNAQLRVSDAEVAKAALARPRDTRLLYVLSNAGDPFSGEFYLTDDLNNRYAYGQWYREAATQSITLAMSGLFTTRGGSYTYTYTLGADEQEASRVTVEITPDRVTADRFCTVTATAEKMNGDASVSVQAYVCWSAARQEAVAIPALYWKDPPEENLYAVFSTGLIDAEMPDAVLNGLSDQERDFDREILNQSVVLPSVHWTMDCPVVIINNGDSPEADLSGFYENGEPLPSLLVNNTEENLMVYASDAEKNQFRGLMVSRGGLTLSDVAVTGRIMAKGDVQLSGGAHVELDADAIFAISSTGRRLSKMLGDYLRITHFGAMAGGLKETADVSALLGRAGAAGYSVEIKNFDGVALEVIELREIE